MNINFTIRVTIVGKSQEVPMAIGNTTAEDYVARQSIPDRVYIPDET